MIKFIQTFFGTNYFLVFQTDQLNYCWRVTNKKFFAPLPKMINQIISQMEKEGQTNIALIKIKKI